MRQTPYSIYLLSDPNTGAVRYVGCSKNPKSRLSQHIKESMQRQNTAKKAWIHNLMIHNTPPVMQIVAQIMDPTAARIMESQTCHQHRQTIYNLHDPKKGAKDFETNKTKNNIIKPNKAKQ